MHQVTSEPKHIYKCNLCDELFEKKKILVQHVADLHNQSKTPTGNNNKRKREGNSSQRHKRRRIKSKADKFKHEVGENK